ncbi:MAG: hypothetical protein JO316_14230 [Abitibacteriaceae bacterium]|nr:hypothetical protein [Abditibacteriaceae bacterium]
MPVPRLIIPGNLYCGDELLTVTDNSADAPQAHPRPLLLTTGKGAEETYGQDERTKTSSPQSGFGQASYYLLESKAMREPNQPVA